MIKVLVVDDDEHIRRLLRHTLMVDDYEVYEAGDGQMAVEVCRKQCPAVMIIDLIMPEKEGLETIRQLRQEYPDMRILAISGGGTVLNEPFLHVAQQLGADSAMAKPFSPMALLQTVGRLLGRPSTVA